MIQGIRTESVNSFLIEHLIQIENEMNAVLKEFYPSLCESRMEYEQLLGNYIANIQNYVKSSKTPEDEDMQVPFVLIGSIVDVQYEGDKNVETIQIVSPFLNQGQINYTFASYLSPMGRGLLLKRKGDSIKVKLPDGYSNCIINNIRLSC